MAGCPSSHQPTRIREETLESGGPLQQKLNFRLRTLGIRCTKSQILLLLLLLLSNAFQKMSQKLLADHKIKLNYGIMQNKLILTTIFHIIRRLRLFVRDF